MAEPGAEPGLSDSFNGISHFAATLYTGIYTLISSFCVHSLYLGLTICVSIFTPKKYHACRGMPQGTSPHFSAPAHTFVASLAAHLLASPFKWPYSDHLSGPSILLPLPLDIILWVLLSSMVYSPWFISPLTQIPEFQLKPWASHLSQREDQAIAMRIFFFLQWVLNSPRCLHSLLFPSPSQVIFFFFFFA